MIAIHKVGDLYSACSSAGLLFSSLPREAAAAVLAAAGFDTSLLDTPSDPVVFRSSWTEAVNSELAALNDAIDRLPPEYDDTDIREKQAELEAGMVQLNRQLQIEALRVEIARTEAELDRSLPITMQLMGPHAKEWEARLILQGGPLGKRLQALVAELRELQ